MDSNLVKIIKLLIEKAGYIGLYENSIYKKNDKYFFVCSSSAGKLLAEFSRDRNFYLKNNLKQIIPLEIEDKQFYTGFFDICFENFKDITILYPNMIPSRINKKISFGFGDRIGIATHAHAESLEGYDIFPIFAQQSIREITKTSKSGEEVILNSLIGVFQSGFKGNWGSDADHIRDEEWLKKMVDNKFLPYTMFTLDTYDYIDTESCRKDFIDEKEFKIRFKKAEKYIGKTYNFNGFRITYSQDSIYKIVKRYYRALDFLLKCFSIIKDKIYNFDFEPAFDEKGIDTTPEEHFYLASELINDGIEFSSFAPKYFGIFEKGIDYIGNVNIFIENLKVHKIIAMHLGNYKLSLHSADDKFKILGPFANILEENFHIKTSGSTWMESLRTIAQCNPDLFRLILGITYDQIEENSKAYYIKLDNKKIQRLLKAKHPEELIEEKETRQLLHVSYGTILEMYRKDIIRVLNKNEEKYTINIKNNYKKHLESLFGSN